MIPRFTLREMFVATTLIALGLGALVATFRHHLDLEHNIGLFFVPYFGACATIGAGLFTPFHNRIIGAIIGAFVGFLFLLMV